MSGESNVQPPDRALRDTGKLGIWTRIKQRLNNQSTFYGDVTTDEIFEAERVFGDAQKRQEIKRLQDRINALKKSKKPS